MCNHRRWPLRRLNLAYLEPQIVIWKKISKKEERKKKQYNTKEYETFRKKMYNTKGYFLNFSKQKWLCTWYMCNFDIEPPPCLASMGMGNGWNYRERIQETKDLKFSLEVHSRHEFGCLDLLKKNSFLIVLTLGDKSLLYICGYCQSKPYPRSRQQLASFFGKAGFVHLVDLFCRFFFFSSNINEATSHVTFPEIGNFVLFFKSTPFCVIYFALVMCSSFIQKYPQIKLYLFTLLICLFFFRFFFLEES